MASPSGSPRRGRILALNGIPHHTDPFKVLERLQALAGRLQRACTSRSNPQPSMAHSLAAQQQHEAALIPGCPCPAYSLKAEFSTREAASKARDLLIAQPQPLADSHHFGFGFSDVGLLPNFVLEEEDTPLEIPAIISTVSGCGLCGGGGSSTSPSPRSEDIHARRTSASAEATTHLCVPIQHNGFTSIGNNPYYNNNNNNAQHDGTSTTLSSGSSLASPHRPPSRLSHSHSRQGSYSTFSSVSARSSPGASPQHHSTLAPPPPTILGASPPMEAVGFGFSLPPFDPRDPFHPHHSHSALQDGLLFSGPSAARPKLPSAIPALGGYITPAYLSHSRQSSYGQTPTAPTYQAPLPFQPHNVDREWGPPQRLYASSAASSPPKIDANKHIPVAPAVYEFAREHHQQVHQSQVHRLCHTPLGEGGDRYSSLPVQASTTDTLRPTLATHNNNKLDFRAALTANSTTSARAHLAVHNRSQSMGIGSRANVLAVPPTAHGHTRSSSVVVGNNNNNNAGTNNRPNATTPTNGGIKCNGGHKRSKSSISSTHSHAPSHKSADIQKTFAFDPHRGPRSTDWMLSPETLAARPSKDAKFAQMVALGLASGRTKAGWAQARRPGKRDRDAAKRKLVEGMERRLAEVQVDELADDIKNMTVAGAYACTGTGAGTA